MRKTAALLLVCLLFACPAQAAELDLDALDLPALLALHERLDARLAEEFDCLLDRDFIYAGVYTVGVDVAPGRYLLTSVTKTYLLTHLYADEAHRRAHEGGQHDALAIGDTLSLTLEEGMILVIDQGVARMVAAEPPAWAR